MPRCAKHWALPYVPSRPRAQSVPIKSPLLSPSYYTVSDPKDGKLLRERYPPCFICCGSRHNFNGIIAHFGGKCKGFRQIIRCPIRQRITDMCYGLDIVWTLILQKVTINRHKIFISRSGNSALYKHLRDSATFGKKPSWIFKSYLRNQFQFPRSRL